MIEDREAWVRRRAYELWQAEGSPDGREHAHWEQAESEADEALMSANDVAAKQDAPAAVSSDAPAKPARKKPVRKTAAAKTARTKTAKA